MRKKATFNISSVYIILWMLYMPYWNNCDIPILKELSVYFLGAILLISGWFTIKALSSPGQPIVFKAINLLTAVFCVYGVVYICFGEVQYLYTVPIKQGTYLVSYLRSFLPVYTFWLFAKEGYLTEKNYKFWTLAFLCVIVLIYIRSRFDRAQHGYEGDFTNNTGYMFCAILPCVYFFKKKTVFQFIFMGICFAFLVMSLKRGAILAGFMVILKFVYDKYKSVHRIKKIGIIILITASILITGWFIDTRMSHSERFVERIEETLQGRTSHRDVLAEDLIDYWLHDATFVKQMFGSGADATFDICGNYAHNDWLEILVCQGLFGIMCYTFFWVAMYRQWRTCRNQQAKNIIAAFCIVYFLRTLFSMTYSMVSPDSTMALGYALAHCRQDG